jgi:hypothetical protein
MDEGIAI